jgi:hypothetical protein
MTEQKDVLAQDASASAELLRHQREAAEDAVKAANAVMASHPSTQRTSNPNE